MFSLILKFYTSEVHFLKSRNCKKCDNFYEKYDNFFIHFVNVFIDLICLLEFRKSTFKKIQFVYKIFKIKEWKKFFQSKII